MFNKSKTTGCSPKIGIYKIIHTISRKCYVGSSTDIDSRFKAHRMLLKNGSHHSKRLQYSWNKYHESEFEFVVVELCDESLLRSKELHYVKLEDSYRNGFNGTDQIGKKVRHPKAILRKMKRSALRLGKNEELRRKRSENAKRQHKNGKLGRQTWSELVEKIVSKKLKKSWVKRKESFTKTRACSICGIWGWVKQEGIWHCQNHDPDKERNRKRNEARIKAQKAIPREVRLRIQLKKREKEKRERAKIPWKVRKKLYGL